MVAMILIALFQDSNSPASVPSTLDLNHWTSGESNFQYESAQNRAHPHRSTPPRLPNGASGPRRRSVDSILAPTTLPTTQEEEQDKNYSRHYKHISIRPDKRHLLEHQRLNTIRHAHSEYLTPHSNQR